jgi:hypothetical protein
MRKHYNYSARLAVYAAAVFLLTASAGQAGHAHKAKQAKTASSEFNLPQHPNIGGLLPTVLRYGITFNPLKGVLAYDMQDGYLDKITVSGSIDTRKPGSKHLTYSVRNSRGDTKTIQRKIFVLPRNTFAYIFATARRGPKKIIPLNSSYLNKLTDGITYIKPVVYAVPGTEYSFKIIERSWNDSAYTTKETALPGRKL